MLVFASALVVPCLQDDTYEHQGAHVFLPGSNLRLLQGLAKGVPILYKTPALLVQYCDKGVRHIAGCQDSAC